MGFGSTTAVEDAEDQFRKEVARLIAEHAAELVGAGDLSREAAIQEATEHQRYCQEIERDETGTVATLEEAQRRKPSCKVSPQQVQAIADDLMEMAYDAADSLSMT